MHLSKRLNTISSICQPAKVLADVGCDHAYLSIHMVKSGMVDRAIAMDLREGPLKKAAENVEYHNLSDRISLRLSNGVEGLEKNEADMVLISGMGGILICNILTKGRDKLSSVKQLVLQPQSDIFMVRHLLHENGMKIDEEKMCFEDGKYYTCMRASFGEESYQNEYEYEFGKLLIDKKDSVLISFLEERICKTETIISAMKSSGRADDDTELVGFEKQLETYRRLMNEITG